MVLQSHVRRETWYNIPRDGTMLAFISRNGFGVWKIHDLSMGLEAVLYT